MGLHIVVAYDRGHGISKEGIIPWKLPLDLAWFRQITEGNVVIMGRKTFQHIGGPLENRKNIVLSRTFTDNRANVLRDLESALELADVASNEVFVIGGESVYDIVLDRVNTVFATEIDGDFNCDKFFPKLKTNIWREKEVLTWVADEHHTADFKILRYDRNYD